ncbi:unnamed protein product [Cladocopium goreaui]|uniref:Nephrocystin-3 n=1 Tax=Cladocopium goreaui TaxID=2562237 RepID=A0A9P1G9M1_9DINO|nr:unnamed protein product [Cladocopium goreaui]
MHDLEAQMRLRQQRKWMCVGYNARGEPEGEKLATDADFLISFASPDRDENNRILHELKTGVNYDGGLRPVTFCTDKSLGMGLHINEAQEMRRWNPIFSDLDQPRQPGEYPPWFKHYKEAANETRHGLLILQLTDSYLKSKACRWEFGYVRKPELVHVYVPSGDKSPGRIVKWEELMEDVELCKQLFGGALGRTIQANLDAEDPTMQGTLTQLEKMAETAEEQEHQVWCELPFRQLAYNFAANTFGEESVDTMRSAGKLIVVFNQTGFAAKAQQIGKDLLEKMEKKFGKDHFIVATTLTNLGIAHGDLGDYRQKKDLLERALRITEQHYGKEHPEVAASLASLGNAHGSLGNYSQQKDLLERALRITEQHYGKEHPYVGVTLTNLGNTHESLGDYRQQKDLLERALRIKEQHYGKEHPEVAITLTNLGNAHGYLGNYRQQKDLLERALRMFEQHYGKEHLEVAKTLANLSNAHERLGDYRQQKDLLERALRMFEQHYGKDHPEVAKILNNLGNAHGLGDYRQKKDLLERALRIKEQHYGKEHPQVAITLANLGNAHGYLGNYSQQKDLLERALTILEQHYGKDHPHVAITVFNLSAAHECLGDVRRAKELVERAFKIWVEHGHPYADTAQRRLAEMEVKMMQISSAAVRPSVLASDGHAVWLWNVKT